MSVRRGRAGCVGGVVCGVDQMSTIEFSSDGTGYPPSETFLTLIEECNIWRHGYE